MPFRKHHFFSLTFIKTRSYWISCDDLCQEEMQTCSEYWNSQEHRWIVLLSKNRAENQFKNAMKNGEIFLSFYCEKQMEISLMFVCLSLTSWFTECRLKQWWKFQHSRGICQFKIYYTWRQILVNSPIFLTRIS